MSASTAEGSTSQGTLDYSSTGFDTSFNGHGTVLFVRRILDENVDSKTSLTWRKILKSRQIRTGTPWEAATKLIAILTKTEENVDDKCDLSKMLKEAQDTKTNDEMEERRKNQLCYLVKTAMEDSNDEDSDTGTETPSIVG